MPWVALAALVASPLGAARPGRPSERVARLERALAARGLEADAESVQFVDEAPSALASRVRSVRALLRARRPGRPFDVYLARVRTTPEGSLLALDGLHDVSRTEVVSEALLATAGTHAAWAIGDGRRYYRIEIAELDGERIPSGEDWPRTARIQRAITNLQHTGQLSGIGRRSFKLDPAVAALSLAAEPTRLALVADGQRISIPWTRGAPIDGARFVSEEAREVAQPGNLVTWAVDRVRELPWFGDDRMQLTKALAYGLLDRVDRLASRVRPPAEPVDEPELGVGAAAPAPVDADVGFPPPPVPPLVTPPFPDEGVWLSLENDPFFHQNPGVPAPLVTTHFRADGARPDCRVIVVAWDPRQVELDAVPGTEEPESATGETGTGMIPRKPEIVKRLLAAFNGAFQSTHGDYGMQVDGALIVPPKPYAATVARTADGATVFGTWPYDLTIPKDLVSFRQNLTPLVDGGKFNPYGRQWWGGVPHDWEDETHTVRSGLCLTREGFVAYFYGTKIDHEHLGRAMLAARCDYGIHLDMNQGHTGLELYRVFEPGELPPIGRKLDPHFEAEDAVLDMPGYRFRGRKLFRGMQLMHFPRYIRRGARDYFFLTLRPTLPGPALGGAATGDAESAWKVTGLAQGGFPPALATASIRPAKDRPETKVRLLKFDPSVVRPRRDDDPVASTLVALGESPRGDDDRARTGRTPPAGVPSLWLTTRSAVIADAAPAPGAVRVATGSRSVNGPVAAALAIDDDGMVIYAEVATSADPSRDGALLEALLGQTRARATLFLAAPLVAAISGVEDLAGHPARVPSTAIRLVRDTTPRARRIFQETPILPPQDWMPLQRQTRIFPKEPEATPAASADSVEPQNSAPSSLQ